MSTKAREVAKNLLDISASVKEAATGLLLEDQALDGKIFPIVRVLFSMPTFLGSAEPSEVVERANKLRKLASSSSRTSSKSTERSAARSTARKGLKGPKSTDKSTDSARTNVMVCFESLRLI